MPTRIKKPPKKVKARQPAKPVVAKARSTSGVKTTTTKSEIRIFVSYSHKDAGAEEQLQTHLATLKRDSVSIWSDNDLDAGDSLNSGISLALRRAHMFIALLSPDYIASNYCWNIEYKRAMGRRARGTMRVVAAVVRPCTWKSTSAARFKLLPKDGRAVTKWRSADDAFLDIAEGIRGTVTALRKELAAPPVRKTSRPAKPLAKKSPARKTKPPAPPRKSLARNTAKRSRATKKAPRR